MSATMVQDKTFFMYGVKTFEHRWEKFVAVQW